MNTQNIIVLSSSAHSHNPFLVKKKSVSNEDKTIRGFKKAAGIMKDESNLASQKVAKSNIQSHSFS